MADIETESRDLLTRLLNPAYRNKKNWSALIAALAAGDAKIKEQAQNAFDQLYISTAVGRYLEKRAADRGIKKPAKTGMLDDLFRTLAISVSNSKLTQGAFLEVLDVLYGPDAVRAYVETDKAEPFVLADTSTLQLLIDEKYRVDVVFNRQDFKILRRATAEEVSAVITRACEAAGTTAYAIPYTDPVTGDRLVRIYSGSRGLTSSVRVVTGSAQHSLHFQDLLFPGTDPLPGPPVWTISVPSTGKARFSCDSDAFYNFAGLEPGDYFVVAGLEFNASNRGVFVIESVSYSYSGAVLTQYVEVSNASAVAEIVNQFEYVSIEFYRPTRRTVYDSPAHVVVNQYDGVSRVSIPATTRAVNRQKGEAAYLHVQPSTAFNALTRDPLGVVTITASANHNIAVGEHFIIDGMKPEFITPPVTAGTPSGAFAANTASGISDLSARSWWSRDVTYQGALFRSVRDHDGDIWMVGGVTMDGVAATWTSLNTASYFAVDSTSVTSEGRRQHTYHYRRGSLNAAYNLGSGVVVSDQPLYYNWVYLCGGWTNGPWANIAATNLQTIVGVLKKTDAGPTYITFDGTAAAAGSLVSVVAEPTALLWPGTPARKLVVTGGCSELNRASNAVQEGPIPGGTWNSQTGMKQARVQHKMVLLDNTHALVIGGRQPASDVKRAGLGFSSWNFDDAFAAVEFAGPVNVSIAGNTRCPGKLGFGCRFNAATSTSIGGANQATLNTDLLGDWTISGWMTASTGVVFRNGVDPWAAQADNTLIEFGVDPTDDLFFIRWQHGAGGTVVTKKTAATRATLMGIQLNSPNPRYHHFAITKDFSAGNATFTLYINGASAGQWTDTAPDGGANGLWEFSVVDGAIPRFQGALDAIGFTTTILSAADVREQYYDEVGVLYDNPTDATASPVGKVLNTCEIVPQNASGGNVSVYTGPMSHARFGCGVVKLPDGRIVVAGGIGYNPSTDAFPHDKAQRNLELRSAEVYEPSLGIWSPLPDMLDAHSHCVMEYVARENRIYISGGFSSRRTEYLDVATLKWHVSTSTWVSANRRAYAGGGVTDNDVLILAGGADLSTSSGGRPTYDTITNGGQDLTMGPAADEFYSGGLNGVHKAITGTTGITLKFQTPEYDSWTTATATSGTITKIAAPAAGGIPGPYIFDPNEGVGVSAISGILAARLEQGRSYGVLTLGSNEALEFPDEVGYLMLRWRYSNQVGPVKYLGRINDSQLALDASFIFPATVEAGGEVRFITSRAPFIPEEVTSIGAFYLTASNAGRSAAVELLKAISGAGIELEIDIQYPGDRGLGAEGYAESDNYKLSDIVSVFGGDNLDEELEELRG